METLPQQTRLAFIGDGPEAAELKKHYADMPNVKFMVFALTLTGLHVSVSAQDTMLLDTLLLATHQYYAATFCNPGHHAA